MTHFTRTIKTCLLIAVGGSLTGCCPYRHLAASTADSVRIETRTHTEYVRDTVVLEIPAQSETITTRADSSHLENDYARSDARINPDGTLFHALATKPQAKSVPFEKPILHRDSIVYRDKMTTQTIEVNRPTWWQQTQIRGFWVLLVLVAVMLRKEIASGIRKLL